MKDQDLAKIHAAIEHQLRACETEAQLKRLEGKRRTAIDYFKSGLLTLNECLKIARA